MDAGRYDENDENALGTPTTEEELVDAAEHEQLLRDALALDHAELARKYVGLLQKEKKRTKRIHNIKERWVRGTGTSAY